MATHSNILAWEILLTEESDQLQFMGLQRVGHDLVTKQKQTYMQRAQTCGCHGGGLDWEFGVSRYQLLHIG